MFALSAGAFAQTRPAPKAMPAILDAGEKAWQQVEPGLRRKAWFNDHLTMVLIEFTRIPGKPPAPPHQHVHEQMTYVVEGRITAIVDGKRREIGVGGAFIVPSNVMHGIELLSDKVVLMDVFTPARDDFRV
jgi:quercetin dioxygenase-like cupin family protein